MKRVWVLLLAAAALGCGDEKTKSTPADPVAVDGEPVTSLWELAPDRAFGGIVIPDGSIATMRAAWLGMEEAVGSLANAQAFLQSARRALDLPIDLFDDAVVDSAGLDLTQGAAVFFLPRGETMIVLPVSDRDKFRTYTKGKREVVDGVEYDFNKTLRGACRTLRGRYVCVKQRDTLLSLQPGKKLAASTAALASELEGDIEVFVDVARSSKAKDVAEIAAPMLRAVRSLVASATVSDGELRVRAALLGKPGDIAGANVGAPAPLAENARRASPSAFVKVSLPVVSTLLPPLPEPWTKLGSKLTGELVIYTPSTGQPLLTADIGVTESSSLVPLVDSLCKSVPATLPAKFRLEKNGCSGKLDVAKLVPQTRLPLSKPFGLSVRVIEGSVRLELSHPQLEGRESAPPMSERGSEMLTGPWNVAIWGEAIGGVLSSDPVLAGQKQLPIENADTARALLWAASHIDEVGFGIGVDADGLRAELIVATFGSDPPDVLAAYQRAVRAAIQGDAVSADLASVDASTRVGRQARIYTSGAYLVAGATGAVAAIVIPAFEKYQQKASAAGASSQ